jgi:hypothetical protein
MRTLLGSKVTALKLMDTLSAPMKQVLSDVTEASIHDISTSSLTVNINNVDNPGLAIDAKLLFLSPNLQKEHLRVTTLHQVDDKEEFILNVSFKIRHEGLEEVKSHIEEIKEFAKQIVPDPKMISFIFEGNTLNIGINAGFLFPVAQKLLPH